MVEAGGHAGGIQSNNLMRNVERAGGAPAEFGFIEPGLAESNGHGGEILGARFPRRSSQASGIGPSAQKQQNGNVRDQVVSHRVNQYIREAGSKLFGWRRSGIVWVQIPIRLCAPLCVAPNSGVARGKRSDSTDRGPRGRNVTELKKRAEARGIKLFGHHAGCQERLDLRCKNKLISGAMKTRACRAASPVVPEARASHTAKANIPRSSRTQSSPHSS